MKIDERKERMLNLAMQDDRKRRGRCVICGKAMTDPIVVNHSRLGKVYVCRGHKR